MLLEKEIIDYKKNEQEILHWVNLKGEYRYTSIINFLKNKKIECTWNNVTYYIKYDQRVLINSFKYIVFLEELYKAFIKKYKVVKQSILLRYDFSTALDEFLSLGEKANYDNVDLILLAHEKQTIVEFRNSVVHNKILLNHLYNYKTLEDVYNIFVKILPNSYRNGFVKDVNSCAKGLSDSLWHIEVAL